MSEWLISRDMNMTRTNVMVNLLHPELWEQKKNSAATPSALADWGFVIGRDISPLGRALIDGALSWQEACILSLAKRGPAEGDAPIKPFVAIMKALSVLQTIPEVEVKLTAQGFTRLTTITTYEELTVDFCRGLNAPAMPNEAPLSNYRDIWLNALVETGLFIRVGDSYELLGAPSVRHFVEQVSAYGSVLSVCPSKKRSSNDYYKYMGAIDTGLPEIFNSFSSDVIWNIFPHFSRKTSNKKSQRAPKTYQLITYGAPGTGKSHGIEEVVGRYADTVRTTFHPDSDYASFVGCYKPTVEKRPKYGPQGLPIKVNGVELTEDVISYSYVPQAFTKAYIRAWSKLSDLDRGNEEKCQFLIIEEINRGNCAQIFGDLFQLLDRRGDGYSKYPIEADADLARYIEGALKALSQETNANIPPEVLSGKKLILPPNLYIWATMNTSDQSLFPMDSAFKRRWDWKYIPIKDAGKNWKIVADGQEFRWWDFLETINKSILEALRSEDKQLGYFFARPDDDVSDVITASKFVNKVLFYLYNDVFKDYELPKGFTKTDGGKFAFADFFLADGEPNETAVKDLLSGLVPLAQPLEVPNE